MLFIEVDPHIGWVIQTIESLQSSNIENILLENFEILYTLVELEFMDLERMDAILSEDRFNTLQRFVFSMIVIGAVNPTDEDEGIRQHATAIATSRLPQLDERGILHVGCAEFTRDTVRFYCLSLVSRLTSLHRKERTRTMRHSFMHDYRNSSYDLVLAYVHPIKD